MAVRLELLYDTETALRLVDDEVRAMTGGPLMSNDVMPMTHALEQIRDEVLTVLATVRDGHRPSGATAAPGVDEGQRAIQVVRELTDLESRLVLITRLLESSVASVPEQSAGLDTRGCCVTADAVGRRSGCLGDAPVLH